MATAVATVAPMSSVHAAAAAIVADSFDGLWLSDGYGQYIEIKGDLFTRYEVSKASCIFSLTAARQRVNANGNVRFVGATDNTDTGAQDAFQLSAGRSKDMAWMLVEGAISNIELKRAPTRPAACDVKNANTPISNYNVFWNTWSEHYPFFALHAYNWDAVDAKFRPQINPKTTPLQLFNIFKAMIAPLNDAHTDIAAESIKRDFGGFRQVGKPLGERDIKRSNEIIDENYVKRPLRSYCNGRIHFAIMANGIGYMRIDSFEGYAKSSAFADQEAALETALDEIFGGKVPLKGLIIDERINGGGSDVFGTSIAARLTDRDYLAYNKVNRNDPDNQTALTDPQPAMVTASKRPNFLGKIVLLTSANSISAAETFAQALLGRTPNVIRIGDNTQGVFSDVLNRKLPNGWSFGLPNEIYLTQDGKAFDKVGVPPDIRVPVFTVGDLKAAKDPALAKAITVLGER